MAIFETKTCSRNKSHEFITSSRSWKPGKSWNLTISISSSGYPGKSVLVMESPKRRIRRCHGKIRIVNLIFVLKI
jgi:hypothetical protein